MSTPYTAPVDARRWTEAPTGIDTWWLYGPDGRLLAEVGSVRLGGGAPFYASIGGYCGKHIGQYLTREMAKTAAMAASPEVPVEPQFVLSPDPSTSGPEKELPIVAHGSISGRWPMPLTDHAAATSALQAAQERIDRMEEALTRIKQWSEAYPLGVFPEPDLKRAHEVLTAAGMTLDAISASNMRYVITQVQAIVDTAMVSSDSGRG